MKGLLLFCSMILLLGAGSASGQFIEEPTDPRVTGRESSPGILHTDQSFADALREQARREHEQTRVRELEQDNQHLKDQGEWHERYQRANPSQRRTMDLLNSTTPPVGR